eukprot:comp21853_c1_seq1/m.31229 comp21853_c1_seq1/g.31229  ORF comp21853_c1_seq1/g.31229 comp21853_c1_seq1/m.31229 type:complete len:237 (-) comp21853_c1_seq1:62-772(-)
MLGGKMTKRPLLGDSENKIRKRRRCEDHSDRPLSRPKEDVEETPTAKRQRMDVCSGDMITANDLQPLGAVNAAQMTHGHSQAQTCKQPDPCSVEPAIHCWTKTDDMTKHTTGDSSSISTPKPKKGGGTTKWQLGDEKTPPKSERGNGKMAIKTSKKTKENKVECRRRDQIEDIWRKKERQRRRSEADDVGGDGEHAHRVERKDGRVCASDGGEGCEDKVYVWEGGRRVVTGVVKRK